MIWGIVLLLFTAVNLGSLNMTGSASEDYTKNLLEDVFGHGKARRIDTLKRPVKNYRDPVAINATIVVLHVYKLDEITGTLVVHGWLEAYWHDPQLQWDPTNYNSIFHIDISPTYIWIPDLTVINNAEDAIAEYYAVNVHIHSNGYVSWFPNFLSKTNCPIDHKYFPFDEHVCSIDIGSWSYDNRSLLFDNIYTRYVEDEYRNEFVMENPVWKVEESWTTKEKYTFDCCPNGHYPYIRHTLRLRRNSPLYKFIFLMPSIMSIILTLAVFWLPSNAGEKITLGGIIVGIQLGLLIALGFTIPPGGVHVPHIVLLCGNSLVMTCLSLVISILVIRLSRGQSTTPVPSLIKNILNGPLALLLCLGRTSDQNETAILHEDNPESDCGAENMNSKEDISIKTSTFGDWLQLAIAIDHLGFIAYCIIFAFIIISSFI